MKWNPLDPDLLAQEVHGAIGFGFLVAVYYRIFHPYGMTWFLLAIAALLIVVLIKEAFWDPTHEQDQPFWPEGVQDFTFYVVGILIGLLFVLI